MTTPIFINIMKGNKMTDKDWKNLISKEFNVDENVASEMLHAMYKVKGWSDLLSSKAENFNK